MYKTQLIKSSTQARFLTVRQLSSTSQLLKWNDIPLAPPDKILGISEAYNNDSNPQKSIWGLVLIEIILVNQLFSHQLKS